jgi:tyrosinase
MLCIMQKPSKLDQTKFPGAKSRYDDFVVVHMNQTMNIHGTVRWLASTISNSKTNHRCADCQSQGSFLSWHRYYTWSFERVLREECGYTGTQPVSIFLSSPVN